jgi:hypothetical protein
MALYQLDGDSRSGLDGLWPSASTTRLVAGGLKTI